jgi:hypothetical protein
MADKTLDCASSQLAQKPMWLAQVGQILVGPAGKLTLVIQLRTLLLPRKLSTMSLFVVSVATKPVISVARLFSNSVRVFVFAASTRAQFPCGQVILVLGELLLPRQ